MIMLILFIGKRIVICLLKKCVYHKKVQNIFAQVPKTNRGKTRISRVTDYLNLALDVHPSLNINIWQRTTIWNSPSTGVFNNRTWKVLVIYLSINYDHNKMVNVIKVNHHFYTWEGENRQIPNVIIYHVKIMIMFGRISDSWK